MQINYFNSKIYYKKGTSLVELIAVIVIMGIIAGIAIPTTIAVINRQKRNAAASSASTVLDAARTVLIEASAGASTIPGVTSCTKGSGTAAKTGYQTSVKALVNNGDLDKNPFTGGTAADGSDASELVVVVENGAKINDFYITYSASTQKFTASSTAPTE